MGGHEQRGVGGPTPGHLLLQPPSPLQKCAALLDVQALGALDIEEAAAQQEGGRLEDPCMARWQRGRVSMQSTDARGELLGPGRGG